MYVSVIVTICLKMEIEHICRTCLNTSNKLLELKSDSALISKIEILTSLQLIIDEEMYPSTICQECVDSVNKFMSFRKLILKSHEELKERYQKVKTELIEIKSEIPLDQYTCESSFDENIDEQKCELVRDNCDKRKKLPSQGKSDKTVICLECNLTFPSRRKLYNHNRNAHNAPGVCNVCGLIVRSDNLKRHVQMHKMGPVICKICEKEFKNPESLRVHLLLHKGETFTCEICGRLFKVKSEHRRHMKIHVDPDALKAECKVCSKRVRDMRKHLLSHTGERPYRCEKCQKGFTSPYALKVHTRKHTNEKPFICEYCSMGFTQKISLLSHVKSKHS